MVDSREIEARAADWLAQRDSADWQSDSAQALEAWLASATAHRVAFLRLEAAWHEAGRLRALGAGIPSGHMPARGFASVPAAEAVDCVTPLRTYPDLSQVVIRRPASPSRSADWSHVAAAAVVLLAVSAASWFGWQASGRHHALYASGIGQIQDITLADGSAATLSSDSRIDVTMSRGGRDVTLTQGEVFFDVRKDASRPFRVLSNNHLITVVGTQFALRQEPAGLQLVVTEGTVRLEDLDAAHSANLLTAGSIAFISGNSLEIVHSNLDDAERRLQWRSGYLSFEDTSLAEASAEFNRFNQRKLEVADTDAAALRIGGNFRWNNSEAFVSLLEQAFPIRAEHHPDRIVLHSL